MPRVVDHEQRRNEIVDAAIRVAVRDGLDQATVRNIAAEAACSVGPVQYYFHNKADLLAAAHARVTDRMAARVRAAVADLGEGAAPRAVVGAIANAFLPTDAIARESAIAYQLFYGAELTDPGVRIKGATGVAGGLASVIASQVRRARPRARKLESEATWFVLALPNIATGVIARYISLTQARVLLGDAIDRLFAAG